MTTLTGQLELRRQIMYDANERGLVVIGQDGTRVRGRVSGIRNDYASVLVRLPFGTVSIEYSWEAIERAITGVGELRA